MLLFCKSSLYESPPLYMNHDSSLLYYTTAPQQQHPPPPPPRFVCITGTYHSTIQVLLGERYTIVVHVHYSIISLLYTCLPHSSHSLCLSINDSAATGQSPQKHFTSDNRVGGERIHNHSSVMHAARVPNQSLFQ